MQSEAYRITLLSGFQVLAFVHIEESHFLQKLLFGFVSNLFDFGKLNLLVEQESQVTLHGRELGEFLEVHLRSLDGLHQFIPIDFGIIDFVVDVELLLNLLAHDTEGSKQLTTTGMNADSGCIYIVGQVTEHHGAVVQAQASEDIEDVCLEFVYAGSFIGMCP